MPSEALCFRIDYIGANAHRLHAGHTLFIPPVNLRETVSFDLAKDLAGIERLKSVTWAERKRSV
jgi:hypothetical protein